MTLLEARRVTKVFQSGLIRKRQTVALADFSLRLEDEPPSITAVVGESGSGKTTLARLLLGLTSATSGEVLYRGKDLRHMSSEEHRVFRRDVQVVFQDPYDAYNPFYKIDHVLLAPIENYHLAKSRPDALTLIERALEAVGLRPEETLGRYPHQLSGGQRQRVMVARALLLKPRLIIADEPVSMVDASLRATILGSLRKLNEDFGISLIYITHDLTTAYQISENIVVLYNGSVAEAGDVEHVVRQPKHPYTQLLISSIPLPNPKHRWGRGRAQADSTAGSFTGELGCKFANRCPFAMAKCVKQPPPLYRLDANRVAACYLYDSAPTLEAEAMTDVFARPAVRVPEGR
jgi:peptide/nickel transport system ATP-binding protein